MFPSHVPHLKEEPLSKYTTYRIGGPAKFFALPKTREDIFAIGAYLRQSGDPYFILGNGSNVLAPDEGFPGVVICTRELNSGIEFLPQQQVRVGASTLNARILRAAAERGLGGLEALSGVPGNIGGAVFMNAGTASGWIDAVLLEVDVVSLLGGERKIAKKDLIYSYREQHFLLNGDLIWGALLQLKQEDKETVTKRLAEGMKKRKAAQPIELPSCGSVFRNPEGSNAWKLISDAGLRGMKQGGASISEKHCNFIVNNGGAKKSDVLFLIQLAKERVYNKFQIALHEEVIQLSPKYL